MDRCKCWKQTKIIITIEHCPSATGEIVFEMDRIIQFAMKNTDLRRFGKPKVSTVTTTDSPDAGD